MKKLSKLSLLGEMDLLSKNELRRLVGAATRGIDCGSATTPQDCENLTPGDIYCECGKNNGKCVWAYNAQPKGFCICSNTYGG